MTENEDSYKAVKARFSSLRLPPEQQEWPQNHTRTRSFVTEPVPAPSNSCPIPCLHLPSTGSTILSAEATDTAELTRWGRGGVDSLRNKPRGLLQHRNRVQTVLSLFCQVITLCQVWLRSATQSYCDCTELFSLASQDLLFPGACVTFPLSSPFLFILSPLFLSSLSSLSSFCSKGERKVFLPAFLVV